MSDDNTYDGYDEIISGETSDQEIPDDYDNFAIEQESSNVYPIKRDGEITPSQMLSVINRPLTPVEQLVEKNIEREKKARIINEGWDDEEIEIPDEWFTTKPAPREYIIENFLPLGVVGIIGAKGGTGKSMLCMQMAISVAGGYGGGEFFGLNIKTPGKVLFLSAEDDRDECHRRIYSIKQQIDNNPKFTCNIDWECVQQNLLIKSLVGESAQLTKTDSSGMASPEYESIATICNTAARHENVNLIIVDTYSRFNGGKENSNEDASMFIRACEKIRIETGATILILAHMRKGADRDAEGIAGGARFVDSSRWSATMTPYLDPKEADKFGMDENELLRHIQFRIGKDNYSGGLGSSIFMYRGDGGVLVEEEQVKGEDSRRIKADIRDETGYSSTVLAIVDVVKTKQESGNPISPRKMCDQYSGNGHGSFGVGKGKLGMFIQRALSEGYIVEKTSKNKKGSILETP